MSGTINIGDVKTYLLALQDRICSEVEDVDARSASSKITGNVRRAGAASAGCWSAAPYSRKRG